MKKILLLLVAVGMIFTACEPANGLDEDNNGNLTEQPGGGSQGGEDNPGNPGGSGQGGDENGETPSIPKIELSQQYIEVDFESAQYSVSVTSPYSWETTSKNDWIIVDTNSGIAGTKELKFSVERNVELDIREGTIVIKNEDANLFVELYVIQRAFIPSDMVVAPQLLHFPVEGGKQEVKITANFEYAVTTTANWITITKYDGNIHVEISSRTIEERTADIVISSDKYNIFKTVKVSQEATQGCIVATRMVPSQAGSFILPISAESYLAWRTRPLNNWLHLSDTDQGWMQGPHSITVHYDSNESTLNSRKFARVGCLALESYDGSIIDTVVVKQRGLTPSMKLEDMVVEASTTECKIAFYTNLTDECRSALTFSADRDWIHSIDYLADGCYLLVKLAVNNGTERNAKILATFTDACGFTFDAKCVLTQKKRN